MANINEARELWLETVYENDDEIPSLSTDELMAVNYYCECQSLYIVVWQKQQKQKTSV